MTALTAPTSALSSGLQPPRYPSAPQTSLSEAGQSAGADHDKSHHLSETFALPQPPQVLRELLISNPLLVPAMSPAIGRSAHRHELPVEDDEEDRQDDSNTYQFANGYYSSGNSTQYYRSGPPSLAPSTPFMMTPQSVVVATPSGPFAHPLSLGYSPVLSSNNLNTMNSVTSSKPTDMAWYSPNTTFHHGGVAGGYAPGTAYPFPTITQELDLTKNGRNKDLRIPKQEEDDDMGDMDDDDHCSTLGLNANGEERVLVTRREDIRRARIEAEQRRRSHLRNGFEKLLQVLPVNGQRNSKSHILDRATSHIQTLQAAFNKATSERDLYRSQLDEARRLNDQLSAAMAAQTTGTRPTPPSPPRHY